MENKSFDNIIKSKLKELEGLAGTPDWEAFESTYGEQLAQSEVSFDDIIKTKLGELETIAATPDWDLFEEMYDEELAGNEALFDRSIADKVDHYNIAFNSGHWALMKEKLEREEFIRTSIYLSKIAEAAIVFLLLFTFLNLFQGFQYEESKGSYAHQPKSTPSEGLIFNNSTQGEIQADNATINVNTRFDRMTTSISKEKRAYIKIESIIADKNTSKFNANPLIAEEGIIEKFNPLLSVPDIEPVEVVLEADKMEIYRARKPVLTNKGKKGESYLGLSFSPTVNIVNSPSNYILQTAPYTVDALGFETGISYSFKKNNFEIGTGITYGKKSYQPQILNDYSGAFAKGYNKQTLQNIAFDMVSVPLSLSYHIVDGNDFSLYASAGSSFNIITNAGYRINDNGLIVENLDRIIESARSTNRDFTQGILQGGTIHDNLFITLDISIGLETKLTDQLSMFIAPTLRQHIGFVGIGPNDDHVHSLGLNLGLKKKL
jgi:opacity protein-like surface antigen